MFNHLYDIHSKTVFMENANFMIFLIYGFSYIVFSFLCMHGHFHFLENETIFNNLCIVGLQHYISYMHIT